MIISLLMKKFVSRWRSKVHKVTHNICRRLRRNYTGQSIRVKSQRRRLKEITRVSYNWWSVVECAQCEIYFPWVLIGYFANSKIWRQMFTTLNLTICLTKVTQVSSRANGHNWLLLGSQWSSMIKSLIVCNLWLHITYPWHWTQSNLAMFSFNLEIVNTSLVMF